MWLNRATDDTSHEISFATHRVTDCGQIACQDCRCAAHRLFVHSEGTRNFYCRSILSAIILHTASWSYSPASCSALLLSSASASLICIQRAVYSSGSSFLIKTATIQVPVTPFV